MKVSLNTALNFQSNGQINKNYPVKKNNSVDSGLLNKLSTKKTGKKKSKLIGFVSRQEFIYNLRLIKGITKKS